MAVLDLFRQTAHVDDDLHILCDSQYVINTVTKWMPGWKKKGWRKGDGKPVLNLDLIQAIDEAIAGRRYRESDADVAATCARLTRFGVDARHLRTFRTSADRQAALLEQILASSLHGRNAERRAQGVRELEQLSELAAELQALLFRRALRDVATTSR